jgi:hypothetical protein
LRRREHAFTRAKILRAAASSRLARALVPRDDRLEQEERMSADYYRWLECEVGPGMWDTERTVRFRVDLDPGSDEVSLFVDETLIRTRDERAQSGRVRGRFRVCLVKEEGPKAVVMLPVQSLKYGTYVAVPVDQLQAS